MNILENIFTSILNQTKKIDISKLPSLGLFYKDDFTLKIKKADVEDIIEYEYNYQKDDVGSIISRVKNIVKKNTIFSNGYTFNDIKSLDIVYLFFEIVKFTNNKPITINYVNELGEKDFIKFNSDSFNYVDIDDETMKYYNNDSKEFIIEGFRFSPPCIGVENSLTNFLISKTNQPNNEKYLDYNYDFLYFLGHKNLLTKSEIDNLIQIYNYDISDEDSKMVVKIIKKFANLGKYTLKKDEQVIDINAKIDLEKVWK